MLQVAMLPGVASLYFTVPRNQTHCLGCPLNEQTFTPCTSAPSGYSGCMALLSCDEKNGQVWGFGLGSGGGGATLGVKLGPLGPSGWCLCPLRLWPWFGSHRLRCRMWG